MRDKKGQFIKGHKGMGGNKKGKDHYAWKIKNPSYGSVHVWLLKHYKYTKDKCYKCRGERFLEWALKKSRKHAHNIKNYYILCSSCHKKYDYTKERRKKLSNSLKGRKILWAKKISIAHLGKKLSEEAKLKISIFNKNNPRERNEKGQFYKKI